MRAALNHACVLSHSRVEDTIAGLCSASLIVQSQVRDKLPKTASRPVLSLFGLRPIRCPSVTIVCSLVLLRARSLSSASITTTPSSPITPIPRRQHQHLSSPPHLQSINRPSQADTPSFPHYSSLHRHARAYRLLAIAAAGVIGTHLQHRDNSRGSCSSDLLLKFS